MPARCNQLDKTTSGFLRPENFNCAVTVADLPLIGYLRPLRVAGIFLFTWLAKPYSLGYHISRPCIRGGKFTF